ncbi:MAG: aminoacyl-tRNA hydrolase [Deltaproteobacteria bacterium]|nr:MAG: aminoacyl-tRNA hydrolase [Deltaproteobacteria bacterium]
MTTSTWVVAGLGNPGPRYAGHRHNAGAMAVTRWADRHLPAGASWREKWSSKVVSFALGPARVVAVLPQTYMNRSGLAVRQAADFHRVPPARVLVVHDELDFPFGRVAIKRGGGHGGHNGLRDIIAHLGTGDFPRVRVGIGRPPSGDVTAWVLSDFSAAERQQLEPVLDRAGDAAEAVIVRGVEAAMNEFNRS